MRISRLELHIKLLTLSIHFFTFCCVFLKNFFTFNQNFLSLSFWHKKSTCGYSQMLKSIVVNLYGYLYVYLLIIYIIIYWLSICYHRISKLYKRLTSVYFEFKRVLFYNFTFGCSRRFMYKSFNFWYKFCRNTKNHKYPIKNSPKGIQKHTPTRKPFKIKASQASQ